MLSEENRCELSQLEKEIEKVIWSFSYHVPTAKQIERITTIRNLYKDLARSIMVICPKGKIKEEAIRRLKLSKMVAIESLILEEKEEEKKK